MQKLFLLGSAMVLAAAGAFAAAAGEESAAMDNEPTVLKVVLQDRGTAPINVDSSVIDAIEEQLNIIFDITAIPGGGDYNQKKRTLIATDDVPDILKVHRNDLVEFGDTGVFLALNEMIDTQVPNYKRILEGNERVQKTAIDGVYYAFATTKRFEFHRGIISVIRTDVVADLGLELPQTFDELYDVLAAIKQAHPDSHVWTNRGGGRSLVRNTSYAFGTGGDIYYDPAIDGGRWAYGPIQPQYRNLLAYLHRAYDEGILDPDFATLTTAQWREKQGSEKSFFFYDNPTYGKRANDAIVPVNPDAWWAPTDVLTNSLGQRRSLFYEEEVSSQMWAVGQKTEAQDAIASFFNFAYTDEFAEMKAFGLEGVHWVRDGDDYRFTEEMRAEYTSETGAYLIDKFMNEVGTGAYGAFSPYIDMRLYRMNWPEYQINWYLDMEATGHWDDPKVVAPFISDEREEITNLTASLNTQVHAAIDKVILGDMSLEEWDDLVAKIKPDAMRLEEIHNAAEKRYQMSR
ncbi:MAG: extracellular solute-binding protein [Spirochaetaceae bacterium]|nr:extracellular solute-binding protein [Spirochaetaceae bacterium]